MTITSSPQSFTPPDTPSRLGLRSPNKRDKATILGQGAFGKVIAVEATDGTELALKMQTNEKVAKKEFIFAKILEAAQTAGLISHSIKFVPALREDVSRKHYKGSGLLSMFRKKYYVMTMKRMQGSLLDEYKKRKAEGLSTHPIERKLNLMQNNDKILAELGFNLGDVEGRNCLYDENGELHFSDFGESSILKGSVAEKFLEKFMDAHPHYRPYEKLLTKRGSRQDKTAYQCHKRTAREYYRSSPQYHDRMLENMTVLSYDAKGEKAVPNSGVEGEAKS